MWETKSKAADFNKSVQEIIYPVFPLLADYFLQYSGIKKGVCLDIGTGNGSLGIALAEKSDLQVLLIDLNTKILAFAEKNIEERGFSDRVSTLLANVELLPFQDNYAQLIVSRGSIFFWKDQVAGLNEIYRTLAPGGITFIGGGFVTRKLMKKIGEKMKKKVPAWEQHIAERIGPAAPERFQAVLNKTKIPESKVKISYDSANLWIIIKK